MAINQITVFLENKAGALLNVTKLLSENKVDLRAINIAETADYGLLRLITADNAKAEKVLREESLIFTETPVLAIAIDDKPGALTDLLEVFAKNDINVHYMYSIFGNQDVKAYMIMQLSDIEKATKVLGDNNIVIAEPKDLKIG
ncbi:MAG: acetolactate synthase [Clostridia bacterium]|nr:acetolactate synthase [Clostridia bacterium]